MICFKDNASYQQRTLLHLLIWVVPNGTRISKSALNAQLDGPSTQRTYVSELLTTAIDLMLQELVLHALMVTLLAKVNVVSLTTFARLPTLLVALHVITDTFFIRITVFHYQALLILFFTTLPVALKSWLHLKLMEDYEVLKFFDFIYLFLLLIAFYLLINVLFIKYFYLITLSKNLKVY